MTLQAHETACVRRFDTAAPGGDDGWVLLVEDSEDDAFFTRRAIAKAGVSCPVITVQDGIDALELLWAKTRTGARLPSMILLDTRLPRRDGFAILEQLRSGASTRPIPVIILTSCSLGEARFVGGDFSSTAFMRKPVTPDRFAATARELEANELLAG